MSKGLWRVGKEELKFIQKTIASGLRGTTTEVLERRFAKKFQVKYAIAVNSGTSALHTAVAILDINPGDEIIVPPLTFAATGFAPLYVGAVPVFADVDANTFNIDPQSILNKITKRTKAIIIVSLYGLPPDMDEIMKIARRFNLKVIEDNAQCMFGKYKGKIAGTIGDISIFSFQRSKHLTTGDGGMIVTNNKSFAERMRKFSDLGYTTLRAESGIHGSCKEKLQQPDFKRHECIGYNFRMPEVCSAMALAQLDKLDMLVERRKTIAKLYKGAISGCQWLIAQKVPEGVVHSYWAFVMRIDPSKTNVSWGQFRKTFLKEAGEPFYGAWSLTYLEPAFKKLKHCSSNLKYNRGLCPVAEALQPNLIQLKTNFESIAYAKKQADALRRSIQKIEKQKL